MCASCEVPGLGISGSGPDVAINRNGYHKSFCEVSGKSTAYGFVLFRHRVLGFRAEGCSE